MPKFLSGIPVRIVSLLLLAQVAAFYAFPKNEVISLSRPLKQFPQTVGDWNMVEESELDSDVQALLKADDTLNRNYYSGSRASLANFYVAFFKTQQTGVSPHSPMVCLPGNGWTPLERKQIPIPLPGGADPLIVNHYTVARGDATSVVLYWYQTHNRVIANEYAAKVYTVLDGLRYHRSDTALVRIVVPVANRDTAAANQTAVEFAQQIYFPLKKNLPL
jgi:EpsI family protein